MSSRFVIQIHSGWGQTHYDLMLAAGEALATWQLERTPAGLVAGGSLPARRLADHRLAYLTYEGPVSGDRGSVRILDSGPCRLIRTGQDVWRFELRGRLMDGEFELRRLAGGDQWLLVARGGGAV